MNIHVTMIMHTLVNEPVELVHSLTGEGTFWHIYVHSQIPEVCAAAATLANDVPGVQVDQVGFNRGLSRTWNEGLVASIDASADVMIIANDDVRASRDDLIKVAVGAMEHRDAYFITADGWHVQANVHGGLQITLAAIQPIAIERAGMFDCNIYPIYHEDSDYFHRNELLGGYPYNVGETGIQHLGSQTFQRNPDAMRQIRASVPLTEKYMLRKWGAVETFLYPHPFNDESVGYKIEIEDRLHPYGKYDRTDYNEVMAM